jgi:predicted HAD superfamily Cof-like phosphohydrolase
MDQNYAQVRAFHEKFRLPRAEAPLFLPGERAAKRYKWMLEELDEFLAARDLCDQADAMVDLIYFALGTLVEMGLPPGKLFEIVHQANMTKLWADGQPHYNPDGKIIKPATWQDPYPILRAEIERVAQEAQQNQ